MAYGRYSLLTGVTGGKQFRITTFVFYLVFVSCFHFDVLTICGDSFSMATTNLVFATLYELGLSRHNLKCFQCHANLNNLRLSLGLVTQISHSGLVILILGVAT